VAPRRLSERLRATRWQADEPPVAPGTGHPFRHEPMISEDPPELMAPLRLIDLAAYLASHCRAHPPCSGWPPVERLRATPRLPTASRSQNAVNATKPPHPKGEPPYPSLPRALWRVRGPGPGPHGRQGYARPGR
jgi:hypothetical protein